MTQENDQKNLYSPLLQTQSDTSHLPKRNSSFSFHSDTLHQNPLFENASTTRKDTPESADLSAMSVLSLYQKGDNLDQDMDTGQ